MKTPGRLVGLALAAACALGSLAIALVAAGCDRRPRDAGPGGGASAALVVTEVAPAEDSRIDAAITAIKLGDKALIDFVDTKHGIQAVVAGHPDHLCGRELAELLEGWTATLRTGGDVVLRFASTKRGGLVLMGVDDSGAAGDMWLEQLIAKGRGSCG